MRSEPFVHPWMLDWPDRVARLVRAMGYADLQSLLATMPAATYEEVANEIGHDVAPIQVLVVQFKEAKLANAVRRAAMDSLARQVTDEFPQGWGIAERPEYRSAVALADWISSIVVSGDCEAYENRLDNIADSLQPPTGWIPTGADDPVIRAAFDMHWPENDVG